MAAQTTGQPDAAQPCSERDWRQIELAGYPGLLKVIQGLAARVARLESASGMPTGNVVVRQVLVDFGHGWQVVAEDDGNEER